MTSRKYLILAAFFAIYFIWGSTFLAVHVAVMEIPPFVLSGSRYFLSGLLLLLWAFAKGLPRPTTRQVWNAAIVGTLLLAGGNGLLSWSMQRVPSGMASLVVTTGPMWLVLIQWYWKRTGRPTVQTWAGLAIGMVGMVVLIGPDSLYHMPQVRPIDIVVMLVASLFWNFGAVYSTDANMPSNPFMMTGIEMLVGGIAQYVIALFTGDWLRFTPTSVSVGAWGWLVYLVVFGSVIGFTSYAWLIRNVNPVKVATHTFVNPIVAVCLGWLVAGEPFTIYMLVSAVLMVGAVTLLTIDKLRKSPELKAA
ncbi:MAG: EamA family transporter [Rhodothermia bacterium]|nr:EamA family transporter [Rhodothermia bacterium]